mmetsp:Transcript_44535/g.127665  ORF Transcript_44535/g.127665 Transcript_44535/m.127665 type:complete len:206 (-) Transcript_44535:835-1452(-)
MRVKSHVFASQLPIQGQRIQKRVGRHLNQNLRGGEGVVSAEESDLCWHTEAVAEEATPKSDPTTILVQVHPDQRARWHVAIILPVDLVAHPLPWLVLVATRHPTQHWFLLRPAQRNREVVFEVLVPARRKTHVRSATLVDERLAMPQQLRAVPHPTDAHLLAVLPEFADAHDAHPALQQRPDIVHLAVDHHLLRLRNLRCALPQP